MIEIEISPNENGSTGNADLYAKQGSPPTENDYDCRSTLAGNIDHCTFDLRGDNDGKSYHYWVREQSTFTGVDLHVKTQEGDDE